jgi:superfamily II DNA/RNA helicase
MEKKINYKIMKLRSGEEIIARITNSTKEKLTVERPMCFRSILTQDLYGTPKEILIMKNWIPLSVENKIDIPQDHIVSFLNPNLDAISLYELEKEKEDTKQKTSQLKKEITEDEEFKQMMKYLSNNTQKLDDMMKEIESQDKEEKKNKKPDNDDMIFMNMMFPPEMLVDLIESEIIDPEIFGEMYKDIKKHSRRKKPLPPNAKKQPKKGQSEGNSAKFTGDQKDHKDYGNRWTDWNPDLSSEEYQ